MLRHVQALAGDIGPRGTGTQGEAAAADYVAQSLETLGFEVERHGFRAVASQNAFPLSADLIALLAIAIYPLDGAVTAWIAALLSLLPAPLYWLAITRSESPFRALLPQVDSRNVLARVPSRNPPRRHAVILAHLDTNRCRFAWQSGAARSLEPLTWLTLAVMASPAALFLTGALSGGATWTWWVSLLPAMYILGTVVTLWRDDKTPFSPGAHDNAASVAVALETAERLAGQPLSDVQVWLAFTGAEETDHAGLKTILKQYHPALRDAAFIDLEGVGSGQLVYLTRQGLCFPYGPDPELLKLAERLASRHSRLGLRAGSMNMEDETRTLHSQGYRAICFAGCDPETGTLPYWHRPDDTPDKISAETLDRMADFLIEFLRALD